MQSFDNKRRWKIRIKTKNTIMKKMKQDQLFDEFKSWMEGKGYKTTVSSSYVSYLRTLLNKLYSGGYSVIPNAETLLNGAVGYPQLMMGLIDYLNDAIQKAYADASCPISPKQLNNGRSAFRKFVEFILGCVGSVKANMQNVVPSAPKPTVTKIKPTKVYQTMMGWETYSHKDLVKKIKNGLSTQDRISGNKVWLPMRVVKSLLGTEWFDAWSEDIIKRTMVLLGDQIGPVSLDQVDKLILKPDVNGKYSVWAVVNGQEYRVYTHTSKGDIVPMLVKGIDQVSLEHIKAIDTTLRELDGQNKLPELTKVSDTAKQVKRVLRIDKGSTLKKNITVKQNQISCDYPQVSASIDLDELRNEMDLIKDDTDYELMEVSQNSSKSKN